MRAHGYVEGRDIEIDYRWGEGHVERLPTLAKELVRSKIDLILARTSKLYRLKHGPRMLIRSFRRCRETESMRSSWLATRCSMGNGDESLRRQWPCDCRPCTVSASTSMPAASSATGSACLRIFAAQQITSSKS